MVRPLRDPHSDRVCGVLLLTVSSEEVIQPRKLTAFRLLIEQVEVKLVLAAAAALEDSPQGLHQLSARRIA